uniref:No apical meristem-associated C-terminal domain-containing protein n=1 Tax=Setaria viridis TaxID=4556 RepID=A0A4U6TND3_SETVI|nr:hypothetical protein SEVIR_7G087200v2 [Setaria viridis]
MEGGGFWMNMINGDAAAVAGLDDLTFPMTQGTQDIYDFSFEVQQEDVEVQPTQGTERPRSTKGLCKRTKKFDAKEDLVVCSAWLNVSKDPIHGANQSRSTFWSRVYAFFKKNKTTAAVRIESSIMHRWLTIRYQVNKYCSCYEAIERRNQSGLTIQDKISDACEMYKELDKDKETFTLIHCWNKLKEQDKWKAKRVELAEQEKRAGKKKQKVNMDSTSRNVEATNTEDVTEIAAPESKARKRPQGVKKAKEALRRGAEADLIKEEKEIMSMDITSLTPLQKQYYETMQQKIIARHLVN